MRPRLTAWKGSFPFNVHPGDLEAGLIESNPRVLIIKLNKWTLEILLYKRPPIKQDTEV